jgi:hypothetical protein
MIGIGEILDFNIMTSSFSFKIRAEAQCAQPPSS